MIVSEHNGVRATVITVKTECKIESRVIASLTKSGGSVPPNGTLEVDCYIEITEKLETMTITATGKDNNGYAFSASVTYYWDWDNESLISFKR